MMNGNQKGLWMPDQILSNRQLSMADKIIVSHVGYQAALQGGLCYDTNAEIADACYLHPVTVSKQLGHLCATANLLVQWFIGVRCYEPVPDILTLFTGYLTDNAAAEPSKFRCTGTQNAVAFKPVLNYQLRAREQKKYQKSRQPYCQSCQSTNQLVVHHLVPVRDGGTVAHGIITLCDTCHKAVHTIDGHLNWKHVNEALTTHFSTLIHL